MRLSCSISTVINNHLLCRSEYIKIGWMLTVSSPRHETVQDRQDQVRTLFVMFCSSMVIWLCNLVCKKLLFLFFFYFYLILRCLPAVSASSSASWSQWLSLWLILNGQISLAPTPHIVSYCVSSSPEVLSAVALSSNRYMLRPLELINQSRLCFTGACCIHFLIFKFQQWNK